MAGGTWFVALRVHFAASSARGRGRVGSSNKEPHNVLSVDIMDRPRPLQVEAIASECWCPPAC